MNKENLKLAEKFKMEIVYDLLDYELVKQKKILIPYFFAKKKSVLPIEEKDIFVKVAVCDPLNISSIKEIELMLQKKIKTVFCEEKIS